jgi:hypothetical protein
VSDERDTERLKDALFCPKIGSVVRTRLPTDFQVNPSLQIDPLCVPPVTLKMMTLDEITRGAVRTMVGREVRELLRPNPLVEYLTRNMPPPKPLPWWRRRWYALTRRLGTALIAWGLSLGGESPWDDHW